MPASEPRLDPGVAVAAVTFVVAVALDLFTKVFAVAEHPRLVVYNHANPSEYVRRVVMSVAALATAYLLDRGAQRLGIGRLWGAWAGAGLLTGGVLANGVSRLIWPRGVPDFLHFGAWIWNLADFEIGIGLTGGLVSIGVNALVAYVRERLATPAL